MHLSHRERFRAMPFKVSNHRLKYSRRPQTGSLHLLTSLSPINNDFIGGTKSCFDHTYLFLTYSQIRPPIEVGSGRLYEIDVLTTLYDYNVPPHQSIYHLYLVSYA